MREQQAAYNAPSVYAPRADSSKISPSYHVAQRPAQQTRVGDTAPARSTAAKGPVASPSTGERGYTSPQLPSGATSKPAVGTVIVSSTPANAIQHLNADEAAQMELDINGDAEEENPTLPEDLPLHKLQQRLVHLERRRGKKEKKLAAQKESIAEQHQEIARQQAQLVELQAAADSTVEEIRSIDLIRSEVSHRVDQLNSERLGASDVSRVDGGDRKTSANAAGNFDTALECLKSAFHGLQTYKDQLEEFQSLLRHFVGGIEATRAVEQQLVPGQTTLQQHFSRTAVPTSPAAAAAAENAAQKYEIHSGVATPAAPTPAEEANLPMDPLVVPMEGQSMEVETKLPESGSRPAQSDPVEAKPAHQPAPNVPVSVADPKEEPSAGRKALLQDLRGKAADKAARAAKDRRSTPYGGCFHV